MKTFSCLDDLDDIGAIGQKDNTGNRMTRVGSWTFFCQQLIRQSNHRFWSRIGNTARHLVAIEPWAEPVHQVIVRTLILLGQRGAALTHVAELRKRMLDELGVDLSNETLALLDQPQREVPDGTVEYAITPASVDPAPVAANPYKGLERYSMADAAHFFGRERFTDRLLENIVANPVVALIGTSGSGKSSVVHAGLLLTQLAPLHCGR